MPADAKLVNINTVRKIADMVFDILRTRPPYPTGMAKPMNSPNR